MGDRLGKVIHVESGFTVVEIVEDRDGGSGRVIGYSLFGVGTDIRKVYSRDEAINALRDHVAAA